MMDLYGIRSGQLTDERVGKDDMNMAVIAHGLSFVEGGLIGPLLVYLIKRQESPFVAFHALQSFLWGVAFFGLAIAGVIFVAVLIAIGGDAGAALGVMGAIAGVVAMALAYLVFEVVACVKASKRKWYRLPLVGELAIRMHPVPDTEPDGSSRPF